MHQIIDRRYMANYTSETSLAKIGMSGLADVIGSVRFITRMSEIAASLTFRGRQGTARRGRYSDIQRQIPE